MASREPEVVRVKLDRARQHLEHLTREIETFTHRGGYDLVPQPNPKPEVRSFGVRLSHPTPDEWSVIIGEAIHDLRSALDHAIYWLSYLHRGRRAPTVKTGFPIYDSPGEFEKRGGTRQISQTSDAVIKFVSSLQTYNSTSTAALNLAALHRLWNQDKHRSVHLWGPQIDPTQPHSIRTVPAFKGIELNVGTVLHHHHAEAFRVWFDRDPGQVKVEGEIPIHIAFGQADPADDVGSSMWAIYDSTVSVVSALLAMMKHPDRQPL